MNDARGWPSGRRSIGAALSPRHVRRRCDRPPPWRRRLPAGHQRRDARKRLQLGARQHAPVRLRRSRISRDDYTQIAIQGPKGVELLQKLTDADLRGEVLLVHARHGLRLKNILIARTGYTAEDGFEIYVPSDEATSARVWNEVLEAGKEFGACLAAWARATRCASKASSPLRPRNFRYDQCLGSWTRPLLQDGKGGVRRP